MPEISKCCVHLDMLNVLVAIRLWVSKWARCTSVKFFYDNVAVVHSNWYKLLVAEGDWKFRVGFKQPPMILTWKSDMSWGEICFVDVLAWVY